MTKLYYVDSHMKEFDAVVISCVPAEKAKGVSLFAIELDQSVFFPEAGGQNSDTGCLVFGEAGDKRAEVLDVQEVAEEASGTNTHAGSTGNAGAFPKEEGGCEVPCKGNPNAKRADVESNQGKRTAGGQKRNLHYVTEEIPAGTRVHGILNWEERFAKMQNHSAEHIISGLIHAKYGLDNIGFHLNGDGVSFDFNKELTEEELAEIEREANEIVWKNVRITTSFPSPEELPKLTYRSKLDLKEDVRLVEIEGVDVCACCAPHVDRTGEIGMIKLLDTERYKGGIRIRMKAGMFAYEDYSSRYRDTVAVSRLFSVPSAELLPGLEKHIAADDAERERRIALEEALTEARIRELRAIDILTKEAACDNAGAKTGNASKKGITDAGNRVVEVTRGGANTRNLYASRGRIVYFEETLGADSVRRVINETILQEDVELVAVFSPKDGGYSYIIGSRKQDLRPFVKELNAALNGRGGGRPEMVQGAVQATKEQIVALLNRLNR